MASNHKTSDIDLDAIEVELKPKSNDELWSKFDACFSGAARLIAEAAVCVKILEERGQDLKGVPFVGTFRKIAAGLILPELVWKFIESPNRQVVERLPIKDQKRLIQDPMVLVVEPKSEKDQNPPKRRVDLTTTTKEIANLVIGPDGIRSPEEQMAVLAVKKTAAIAGRPQKKEAEPDIREPLVHTVKIRLTETEYKALSVRAIRSGVTREEILRRAVLQTDVLKDPDAKESKRSRT